MNSFSNNQNSCYNLLFLFCFIIFSFCNRFYYCCNIKFSCDNYMFSFCFSKISFYNYMGSALSELKCTKVPKVGVLPKL